MEQGYSFKNILNNTNTKQKIGFVCVVSVIIVLVIILLFLVSSYMSDDPKDSDSEQEVTDSVVDDTTQTTYEDSNGDIVTVETTTDDDGYTYKTESKDDKNGDKVVIKSTRVDQYGNETTTDPKLITTYFPYIRMENQDGNEVAIFKLFLDDTNKKVIEAVIQHCNVESIKDAVREYINSIPLDLSEYNIEYVFTDSGQYCP